MMQQDYIPVFCGDYEILEAACMYRYDVEVHLDDQAVLTDAAIDLEIIDGAEYLVVHNRESGDERVRVDHIHSLKALTRPSLFSEHVFTSQEAIRNLQKKEKDK